MISLCLVGGIGIGATVGYFGIQNNQQYVEEHIEISKSNKQHSDSDFDQKQDTLHKSKDKKTLKDFSKNNKKILPEKTNNKTYT